MSKKVIIFFIVLILIFGTGLSEISSLSQIFLVGKVIKDLDGDNRGDKVSLEIIIPSAPSEHEISIAADIAARANLESLAQNFFIVKKESEIQNFKELENFILIGSNVELIKELEKKGEIPRSNLKSNQGLVTVFSYDNQKGIALIASSQKALLQTGRSFFLRWPYMWDIWGEEEGATYFSLEKDLSNFMKDQGINFDKITIKTALYEFPPQKTPYDSLKKLKFNSGEIKNLDIEIGMASKKDLHLAIKSFTSLKLQHSKGQRTSLLSYPGCSQLTLELREKTEESQIILRRLGYPKRILTPSYKSPVKVKSSGKDFDLTNLISSKGFFRDSDNDKILDSIDTSIIIPKKSSIEGAVQLASRLMLHSAGASFPLVILDSEIENKNTLISPIIVGKSNELVQELLKTGKLKIPKMDKSWALAKVVPQAFNKSNALVIIGADEPAIEKILLYISQIFPYFDDYREGELQIKDVQEDVEEFLKGKRGSAEAYLYQNLKKTASSIKDKNLEYFKADFYLSHKNQKLENEIKRYLEDTINAENLSIKSYASKESKSVFEKEKEFPWEGDEILNLIREKTEKIKGLKSLLKIELGVSESPQVREKIRVQIENLLSDNNIEMFDITVLSAYKQGFFWLLENVLPALKDKNVSSLIIKCAEEKENFNEIKRFYAEPFRWLQELYPVDEILSRELKLPLEKIEFQIKEDKNSTYEVLALDEKNNFILHEEFSPRMREIPFLKVLPEWGNVKVTTGWAKMETEEKTLINTLQKTDLEKFWDFYQDEILSPVYSYIIKKTDNEPEFSKQPYFKRLMIEMWFSEPDYKLGLDEEIISSLESIHDEIYFDTLDFLRGITEIKAVEEDIVTEDTSRYSAPGNVLPLVHPSLEGKKGRVKVVFEDWLARSPRAEIRWKEKGKFEHTKKISFPSIKAKNLRIPSFIFTAQEDKVQNLLVELEVEKEKEYLNLIEILDSLRELHKKDLVEYSFSYPKLTSLTLSIKHKELKKEEQLPVRFQKPEKREVAFHKRKNESVVPTDKIISPQMCLDIVDHLSQNKVIRSYIGGTSYENRKVPVIEIFTPQEKYISLPRLLIFKPTIYISGRQHANEVSSTNYILRLAELLAADKTYQEYVNKMNIILHPMENPDGAELAYELQKLTPFHSLHAGRYTSLGIDVGYQVNVSKPLLPEAKVRRNIFNKWHPDIYLNLHGYPSHEWVQQFSSYSPYLFRDYWIPKGWFAYFRALRLPLYEKWKKAGDKVREFIIQEMKSNEKIKESNKAFYNRYFRWAARWQPHMNYLEIYDNVNLYAKRRSSRENKLSPRRQTTFVEETPEVMDETAHGAWLDFLCQQGLAYINAHLKYLSKSEQTIVRIEEEIKDRIHIQFSRSRPGK
ncbi:MAG: M14 family zinc carboxypeptidase [Candidatus Aminicenantaceae bacterium]